MGGDENCVSRVSGGVDTGASNMIPIASEFDVKQSIVQTYREDDYYHDIHYDKGRRRKSVPVACASTTKIY